MGIRAFPLLQTFGKRLATLCRSTILWIALRCFQWFRSSLHDRPDIPQNLS